MAHSLATPSTSSTAQRLELEVAPRLRVEVRVRTHHVVVRREEESAGAARRIAHRLAGARGHAFHDTLDERARREVLPRPTLGVLGVLLEQPLVRVALHVGVERHPLLAVDQVDDEAAQLGRVLDLVLRLAEDQAEHARVLAQRLERVAVLHLERVALPGQERGPVVAGRDHRRLRPGRLRALVRHLEEEQVGELLDVVAIRQAVVAQDVAVVPELLDDLLGAHSVSLANA